MMSFVAQTTYGLLKLLGLVFIIIMPLLIILELTRNFGLMGKITQRFLPIMRPLGFEPNSVFPLLAGIVFGISYGGGVLIGEARKGRIAGRQAFLTAVFLSICHAVFEDTLLFVAYGAVWWICLLSRLAIASLVTALIAMWLNRKKYEKLG